MNLERHNQIIAMIEANPKSWNQLYWHCGTSHCYGGWAQVLSGATINKNTAFEDARRWLELSIFEAKEAFNIHNSLDDLKDLPNNFTYNEHGYNKYGITFFGAIKEDSERSDSALERLNSL